MAVATIVTIVALPALWLSGRDDAGGPNTPIAVVGAAGALEAAGDGSTSATSDTVATSASTAAPAPIEAPEVAAGDPFGSSEPVFLVGPSTPVAPEPNIVYADPGTGRQATGTATFKRWDPEWRGLACQCSVAPANARLTITNVNNGRTTTCTNVLTRPTGTGAILVLDTDTFLQLANLVEAPLPVHISW